MHVVWHDDERQERIQIAIVMEESIDD